MKYAFIAVHKKTWAVDVMCRLWGVKRCGFYAYHKGQRLDSERKNLLDQVKQIAEANRCVYGSRRIRKVLNQSGRAIGRYATRRLMREAGVCVRYKKKYIVTTQSNPAHPVFSNVLNRAFAVQGADQAYVSDITYVSTQEGWLYLAVVIDLYSRRVIGWSISKRMTSDLVSKALLMAQGQRRVSKGVIVHSDRGSQYTSREYRLLLSKYGYIGSMSRKGNCWDNAVAESFFRSLKEEIIRWKNYASYAEAQKEIIDYIVMFYNSHRLHSYLNYCSPNNYELQNQTERKKA